MGKVHDRISDTNRERKLRFGQATMLGVTFKDNRGGSEYSHPRWAFDIPNGLRPDSAGHRSGYFIRKWEAVNAALRVLGVIE